RKPLIYYTGILALDMMSLGVILAARPARFEGALWLSQNPPGAMGRGLLGHAQAPDLLHRHPGPGHDVAGRDPGGAAGPLRRRP
ncbi:hypothetical protein CKW47_21055, partial [Bordetella pertussis]